MSAARNGGATRRLRRHGVKQAYTCRAANVASAARVVIADGRVTRRSVVGGVVGRTGVAVRAGKEEDASTAAEDEVEDMPPWERRELEKKAAMEKGGLPWPAYLGFSVIVLIASIGSCFELTYGNPIFGVVQSDSFAYKPILYWLIGTGFPLTAYLWIKGIEGANEAAELQDKLDGF